MSSLLDIDVGDAQEPKVVPADEEYELRIIDAKTDINTSGNPYLLPRLEIVGEPLAKDFTKYIGLPHEEMDAKQLNRAKWALKNYLECFGLPTSGQLVVDDMVGSTGWGILGVEDNEQYGEQNYVKKFIVKR